MTFHPLVDLAWRSSAAAATAALVGSIAMPRAIRTIRRLCTDTNASPSPEVRRLHQAKQSTPSMGGVVIVIAWLLAVAAWCAEFQTFVVLAIGLTIGMAGLGAIDDLLKCRRRCGLTRRQKLFGQICIATPIAVVFESTLADGSPWSAAWIVFVIVGSSNAVNLTDGLDGLAAGCCLWATAALGGIALLAHAADDVLVLAAALDGSLLAFFLFNRHPARIFMGDTGSLAIGALLGYLAIGLEREWVWLLVGGVFVAEAVSVIAQIAAFRFTGRRVLRCAPLHHHFQFLGWPETRVVRMLWAWAALCAVLGLLITASIIERPLAWQRLALARSTCR